MNATTDSRHYTMVGCDLHENSMLLAIAEDGGEATFATCDNTPAGRQSMLALFARRAAEHGTTVHVVYEASSLGFGLHDEIVAAGWACWVLAPSKLPRSVKQRKIKTDKKDAALLLSVLRGHLLAGNELPAVWVPDRELRDDRMVVRMRLTIADKMTSAKAQIVSLLKQRGVEQPANVRTRWTRRYVTWLTGLSSSGQQGFGFCKGLASLLREIAWLKQEEDTLDAAVAALAETERYARAARALDALPGVGLLTAMVFLTELGEMARFADRRDVAAYLGLVPTSHESGEANDRKGHITRQGTGRVRKVLCQAAWVMIKLDPAMRARYRAIVKRNPNRRKIAIVAVMRHLAIAMWRCVRSVQQTAA